MAMKLHRVGAATTSLIGVVAVASVAFALFTIPGVIASDSVPARKRALTAAHMVSLGLDPEALAVCGVSETQTRSLFREVRKLIDDTGDALLVKELALKQAIEAQQQTDLAVSRGKALRGADPAKSARDAVANARKDRDQAQAVAWAAVIPVLTQEQASSLSNVRKLRRSELPIEYLTVERSAREIQLLRTQNSGGVADASLDDATPAPTRPGSPNVQAAVVDSSAVDIENSSPVATARARLQAGKAAVLRAWEQELRQD